MIDKDAEAKRIMPMAMRMANHTYKACKNSPNLSVEDFQDAAMEGLTNAINGYQEGSALSVEGYAWYHIKSQFRMLRKSARAEKRRADHQADSYDGQIGIDHFEDPVYLSDSIGKNDPLYEDTEMLLEVFRYAKDEVDFAILNGMLYGMTMESIGSDIGMTKQAVSIRFNNIRNKARAALK